VKRPGSKTNEYLVRRSRKMSNTSISHTPSCCGAEVIKHEHNFREIPLNRTTLFAQNA
jgi:hypothetical protein